MRILYFAPSTTGGIAEYAHAQADALAGLGHEVTVLCTPGFGRDRGEGYVRLPLLREYAQHPPSPRKLSRNLHFARAILANFRRLAAVITEGRFDYVVMDSYFEYLAPFWSWRLRHLASRGVVFGAVLHDPIRSHVVGPRWWHRLSVGQGYSFLRHVFVHEDLDVVALGVPSRVTKTVIPLGPFPASAPTLTRDRARERYGLPLGVPVMLAFGSIRDNKNLDLAIRALADVPEWHLLVAGNTISSSDRPVAFYQDMARRLGVADRCHWRIEFVPDTEIGNVFIAADMVLLTYAATFRSQSGVLSTAAGYQKPVLASSGPGPMRSAVIEYNLGTWVEADDPASIVNALRAWSVDGAPPRRAEYLTDHSWRRNAELVAGALGRRPLIESHQTSRA